MIRFLLLFVVSTAFLFLPIRVACSEDDSRTFPKVFDTQDPGKGLTTAEKSLARFRMPEGFRVTLFAAEPHLQQPIAMATDERGRLWVAENYTYAEREVNFDSRLRDRIVVFEDTDRDGRFDNRTVFWDEAEKLTSVETGFGGVWALCAPHLLFIPDRNRDDRPDSEPVVVLDGFNADEVRHNIVNGLRWGPDGWLYGRHGILATSYVGRPGDADAQRKRINCGIWRYHPLHETFEVVAEGTTNPWGMDWDEHGEMFFINTVIGHLWHVVRGAFYERMYGEHFSPYVYDLIPQTADHFHWDTSEKWSDIREQGISDGTDRAGGGHAHCGMMIYLGDNWPALYRGGVFTVNLHGRRINHDALERHGAGYTAHHRPDPIHVDDKWFRGVELLYGPDGGVYIADWSDIGECHENDGVHRSSGRIFKVTYEGENPSSPGSGNNEIRERLDLARLSSSALVQLQTHKNEWFARQSRRLLQERAAGGADLSDARRQLFDMLHKAGHVTTMLRALWCLYATGGLEENRLLGLLGHENEHVRTWAVRLLFDRGAPSGKALREVLQLAETESSGLVQLHLASSLGRLPAAERFALAERLAAHREFTGDPMLPKMIWYGLIPATPELPDRAVALAETSQMPLVHRNIARRLTTDIRSNPTAVDALVRLLAKTTGSPRAGEILEGMALALRGRRKVAAPAGWERVSRQLADGGDDQVAALTRELSVIFGDGQAVEEILETAASAEATLDARRNAIRTLVTGRVAEVVPLLQELVGQRDLAPEAIRGLAAFGHPATAELIIHHYDRLYTRSRSEAINTLASRPAYALELLEAVEEGRIDRGDVSPFQVRRMNSFGNEAISETLRKLWPDFRHTAADKAEKVREYRELLTEAALARADRSRGRALYEKSCAVCHKLFGTGGDVGPDLTGGQRQNLHYLLENIVDPSATLSENFKLSVVVTADGRILNGIVLRRSDETLTLRTPTERLVIPLEDVELIRESKLSLMPERQLDLLQPEQVRDLVGYLMSTSQVPLSAE